MRARPFLLSVMREKVFLLYFEQTANAFRRKSAYNTNAQNMQKGPGMCENRDDFFLHLLFAENAYIVSFITL